MPDRAITAAEYRTEGPPIGQKTPRSNCLDWERETLGGGNIVEVLSYEWKPATGSEERTQKKKHRGRLSPEMIFLPVSQITVHTSHTREVYGLLSNRTVI